MGKIKLNEQQKKAVDFDKGACAVIAGAGSGKSTLLIERIKKLINNGICPNDILAITFTSNAGDNLKLKLSNKGINGVDVGTFHAICGRILTLEGYDLGKKPMKWQMEKAFKNGYNDKVNVDNILQFISYQKGFNLTYKDQFVINKSFEMEYSEAEYRSYWKSYENIKTKNNQYDFADWLQLTLKLMEKNKNHKYHWRYVLVDENQDSNAIQNMLLHEWVDSQERNIMAVGDYRQCFPTGTKIKTINDYKNIEDIDINDNLQIACGHGYTIKQNISEKMKKYYKGKLIKIITRTGKELEATPQHTMFARNEFNEKTKDTELIFTMFNDKYNHSLKYIKNNKEIYRIPSVNSDMLMKMANLNKKFNKGLKLSQRAILTKDELAYRFIHISDLKVGMSVPVLKDNIIINDIIEVITERDYEGYVYDLNIDNYRNYIANDIVVHNCLYGFNGAMPKLFMDFENQWKNTAIINLDYNYRSKKNIVENANNFIKQYYGDYKYYSDSIATIEEKGKVTYINNVNKAEEGAKIGNIIEKLLENKVQPKDIAVLYRLNSHADYLEGILKQNDIPYYISNNSSFFKRKEINAILSYLRLINDTNDNNAFENIFKFRNYPLQFISNKAYQEVEEIAGNKNLSMYEAFDLIRLPKAWQEKNILSFKNKIENLRIQVEKGVNLHKIINNIYLTFRIEDYIRNNYQNEEDVEDRIQSLKTLISFIKNNNNIESFLNFVYNTNTKKRKNHKNCVQLMTIHGAKGLEWKNVFIISIEDDKFPHIKSELIEEARLFYVGITRPIDNLYLSQIGEGNSFVEEYKLNAK